MDLLGLDKSKVILATSWKPYNVLTLVLHSYLVNGNLAIYKFYKTSLELSDFETANSPHISSLQQSISTSDSGDRHLSPCTTDRQTCLPIHTLTDYWKTRDFARVKLFVYYVQPRCTLFGVEFPE